MGYVPHIIVMGTAVYLVQHIVGAATIAGNVQPTTKLSDYNISSRLDVAITRRSKSLLRRSRSIMSYGIGLPTVRVGSSLANERIPSARAR